MKIKISKSQWKSIGKTAGWEELTGYNPKFPDREEENERMERRRDFKKDEGKNEEKLMATQEQELEIKDFIKNLTSKIGTSNISFYKENDNYIIHLFNESAALDSSILQFIASTKLRIYLSAIDGKIAIFIFKK